MEITKIMWTAPLVQRPRAVMPTSPFAGARQTGPQVLTTGGELRPQVGIAFLGDAIGTDEFAPVPGLSPGGHPA